MVNSTCNLSIDTCCEGEGMLKLLCLYLEQSGVVDFFCLLQTKSNEGDVGCFPVSKAETTEIEIIISHLIVNIIHMEGNILEVCSQVLATRTITQ